jgi:hypothetical protein
MGLDPGGWELFPRKKAESGKQKAEGGRQKAVENFS